MNWYSIENISLIDTPALVVFPERVQHNINLAIQMVGDINRLRPHIKTNKCREACQMMLDAGIQQFKCATIAEAEMLAQLRAKDVLLAYQPLGPKLQRFIELIKKYPQTNFGCLTDNEAAANEQAEAFAKASTKVRVFIDLNIGMNRTGIAPGDAAIKLFELMHELPSIEAAGLHAYDGHLRSSDIMERSQQCNEGFQPVLSMKDSLESKGIPVPLIIAGGSPAFPIHAQRKNVQCSPGTFIYWDHGYSMLCPEQKFLPAAVLVTRIISLPAPGKITTDLGHKSVAAENEITRRIHFLNATDLVPTAQSEEHLVLNASSNHSHKTGEVLYGLPYHVCPTVALYERVNTIDNHLVKGEWKTIARDRKLTV